LVIDIILFGPGVKEEIRAKERKLVKFIVSIGLMLAFVG